MHVLSSVFQVFCGAFVACGGNYSRRDVSPDSVVIHAEVLTNFVESSAHDIPGFLNEHGKPHFENVILICDGGIGINMR